MQFGLDYGINNSSGRVTEDEVKSILTFAMKAGIDTIDTAYAYGNSELILGKTNLLSDFKVVSKLPPSNTEETDVLFQKSLDRLACSKLYGYMLHNFSIYQNDKAVWQKLKRYKEDGLVQKIGVSLYSIAELESLWSDGVKLDIVQVPYNIFDRRFAAVFPELKRRGVEIHTRSTFLQGLFFKSLENLPDHFRSVRDKLIALRTHSIENNQSIASLCLGFVMSNAYIDRVVIGGDKTEHLEENVKVVASLSHSDYKELGFLATEELEIINPSLWQI